MAKARKKSQRVGSDPVNADPENHASTPQRSEWRWLLVAAVLLATAIVAVYFRALDSPLFFDDSFSIKKNPSIRQLWPLWGDSEHPGPFNPPRQQPTSGRPLVNLTFALNYSWGEINPLGYRIVNLAIHFASAMLLMLIVRKTLFLPYFDNEFDRAAGPLAAAIAALWALHPLQTEAVAYLSQRTELLMAFFYLATLYSAIRYWTAASPRGRGAWLALAILVCAAGMASKEMMVSAPLVVLMYDWTFLSRSLRGIWRESWPMYVGLAATWIVLFALNVDGPRSASAGFDLSVAPHYWWFTQSKILWMYLKLVVWPWPLIVHYELPYLTTFAQAAVWLLLTAGLAIGTLLLLWRKHPAGFVGFAVLAILSPTLIVPITSEVAAERRMYLPSAALVALAVGTAYALASRLNLSRAPQRAAHTAWPIAQITTATLVLAAVASLVSARRLAAYESPVTLWQEVLVHQPDNFMANFNASSFLFLDGKVDESIRMLERAVQIRPYDLKAQTNLAAVLLHAGRTLEAIPHLRKSLELKPDEFKVYTQLASAYVQTNQPDQAIEIAERAAQLARSAGQTNALNQIEQWLKDYRAEQKNNEGEKRAQPANLETNTPGNIENPG